MKWIRTMIEEAVKLQLSQLKIVLELFDKRLAQIDSDVGIVKKRWNEIDSTVASMTFEELDQRVQRRIDKFEGIIDDKIIGLYRRVDEKIAERNSGTKSMSGLLQRIAELEDIKETAGHRRSVEELIKRKEFFQSKLLEMDKKELDTKRYSDAIEVINWCLNE